MTCTLTDFVISDVLLSRSLMGVNLTLIRSFIFSTWPLMGHRTFSSCQHHRKCSFLFLKRTSHTLATKWHHQAEIHFRNIRHEWMQSQFVPAMYKQKYPTWMDAKPVCTSDVQAEIPYMNGCKASLYQRCTSRNTLHEWMQSQFVPAMYKQKYPTWMDAKQNALYNWNQSHSVLVKQKKNYKANQFWWSKK